MENTKIGTAVKIISVESEDLTKLKKGFNELKYSEQEKQDLLSSIEKDFIDRGLKIENEEEKYGYVIDILREFMRIDKQRKNTKLKTLPETICTKKFKLIEKTKEAVKDQIIRSEGKFPGYFWLSSKKTDISNRAKNYIDSLKKGAVKNTFGFNLCIRSEDIDYREIYFRNDKDCEEMIGFIYLTPIQVAGYPWDWHDATSLNIFIEEEFRRKGFFDEIVYSYTNMALKHIAQYDENKLNIDFHRRFREKGQGSFIKFITLTIPHDRFDKLGFENKQLRKEKICLKYELEKRKSQGEDLLEGRKSYWTGCTVQVDENERILIKNTIEFINKITDDLIGKLVTHTLPYEEWLQYSDIERGFLREVLEESRNQRNFYDSDHKKTFEITKEMLDKVLLQNKDKFDFIEGNPSFADDEKNILNLDGITQISGLNKSSSEITVSMN